MPSQWAGLLRSVKRSGNVVDIGVTVIGGRIRGRVLDIKDDYLVFEQRDIDLNKVVGLPVVLLSQVVFVDLRPVADDAINAEHDDACDDADLIGGTVECQDCGTTWPGAWEPGTDETALECPVCDAQDSRVIAGD